MMVRRLQCWLIAYVNSLLWPLTPCNFLDRYQSLWELTASVFRVEGTYRNTWRHFPEDRILNTYHHEKLTSDIDTNIT